MVHILILDNCTAPQHNPPCSGAYRHVGVSRRSTNVNAIPTYNGALHCGPSTVRSGALLCDHGNDYNSDGYRQYFHSW